MSGTDAVETAVKTPAKRGNFFHIDRRTWAALCDLEDVKMAVAYLAIAQGTWKGGRFSSWSAKSIEKHTGLHSTRAKEVIGRLITHGFLRLTQESTRRSPRYEVVAFHEVETTIRERKIASLSGWHRMHFDELLATHDAGMNPKKNAKGAREALLDLVRFGLALKKGDQFFCMPLADPSAELIWLPNTIIQGTGVGEPEPVRLLRARNDIWVLRLFIDLYDDHTLSAEGGISRYLLSQKYERKRLGQRGRHFIWGFTPEDTYVRETGAARIHYSRKPVLSDASGKPNHAKYFFQSFNVLRELGLLYQVAHLVENEDSTCEIIHAYGTNANAEELELELGEAAQEAGEYMLGQELTAMHEANGIEHLAPIFDSYPDAQMVGVYRLRYRPKTLMTAEWMRRLGDDHRDWIPVYFKLAERSEKANGFVERTA